MFDIITPFSMTGCRPDPGGFLPEARTGAREAAAHMRDLAERFAELRTRISHRRIVWSLIIYCKQTVIEIFGQRQKYRVFFRSGPFFVRRWEGLHGFGEPLQGAPRRRPVFPVLQHIDDRLVG